MKLRYAVLLVMVFVAVPLMSSAQTSRLTQSLPTKPSSELKCVRPYCATFLSCVVEGFAGVQVWQLSSHPRYSFLRFIDTNQDKTCDVVQYVSKDNKDGTKDGPYAPLVNASPKQADEISSLIKLMWVPGLRKCDYRGVPK